MDLSFSTWSIETSRVPFKEERDASFYQGLGWKGVARHLSVVAVEFHRIGPWAFHLRCEVRA